MKAFAVALLLVSSLFAASCQSTTAQSGAAASSHPLQGDWELVSAVVRHDDGRVMTLGPSDLRSLKVIGPTRFAFITTKPDGTFVRAAGGTYTVAGNRYSERVEQTAGAPKAGETYTFDWRVEGDLWHHTGTVGAMKLEEVWRRLR